MDDRDLRPPDAGTRPAKLLARGSSAEAIGYALNLWNRLVRFVDDGGIEIDPSTIERTMPPVSARPPRRPSTRGAVVGHLPCSDDYGLT